VSGGTMAPGGAGEAAAAAPPKAGQAPSPKTTLAEQAEAAAAAGVKAPKKGGTGKAAAKARPRVGRSGPLQRMQVAEYFEHNLKSHVGDELEGHEILQNLWLEANDYIIERGRGMPSRWNPTVALDPKLHDLVTEKQSALGLFDRAKLAKMSYDKVLALNALALRQAGVPQDVIDEALDEAFEHAIFTIARSKAR
jgi:hypothetical protein